MSSKLIVAQDIVSKGMQQDGTDEVRYSDRDIKNAFKFLDLDRNSYIGASELKHVLINMGELITDEEVDMMISMLDHSGDGQVNLQQFALMVKSPADSLELGNNVINPETYETIPNNHEDKQFSLKRNVLSSFVVNNKIHKEDINTMRDFFLEKGGMSISDSSATSHDDDDDSEQRESKWDIDYDVLCRILPIEKTGETRQLFDLFNEEGSKSKIDTRELLLGLCNFIETFSTQERCELMFDLYKGSGSDVDVDVNVDALTERDVSCILAANHLKSRKAVARKANTVMKYAQNSAGSLSMADLQDAATKFPNLLFPKHFSR